jgi:prepilin-type N-terminal cleavage/methylation domain-containing protein
VKHARTQPGGSPPRSGFTLIELLLVMAASGVIFTALSTFTHTALHTTDLLQSHNLAGQTARTALARIVREASLARLISATEEYRLAFTCTDITGNGMDDTVAYSWSPITYRLARTLNGSEETFAEGITDFRFEYLFETENQISVAAPGDLLGMELGQHRYTGVAEADREDLQVDIGFFVYAIQGFTNQIEVPEASSITLRMKTKVLPPGADLSIFLTDGTYTVAQGSLSRWHLTTTFQDVTIPLTWLGGNAVMQPDKAYYVYLLPTDWFRYSGTLLIQRTTNGSSLPNGLGFRTNSTNYGSTASAYFTLRGNLPITTPRRDTTASPVLKTITIHMTVNEKGSTYSLSRSGKVTNN